MSNGYSWQGLNLPQDWGFWQQTFPQLQQQAWEGYGAPMAGDVDPSRIVNPWEYSVAFGGAPYGLTRAAMREAGFRGPFGAGRAGEFLREGGREATQAAIQRLTPQLQSALQSQMPQPRPTPEPITPTPVDLPPSMPTGDVAAGWDLWQSMFPGLDPSQWEGYGVNTGYTVNPWDTAQRFGVPQGILRAALSNLGFNQAYGHGRGQEFIEQVGEQTVRDMLEGMGAPQQPAAGEITAYQPNYGLFYDPQAMSQATMAGFQPSFSQPWYTAQTAGTATPEPTQPTTPAQSGGASWMVPQPATPDQYFDEQGQPTGYHPMAQRGWLWDPQFNGGGIWRMPGSVNPTHLGPAPRDYG